MKRKLPNHAPRFIFQGPITGAHFLSLILMTAKPSENGEPSGIVENDR
jgi:hypothetical protein